MERIEDGGTAPYTVEKQFSCNHCGGSLGRSFVVIGPDDVPLGATYDDEADADELASALNAAYTAGRESAR